MPNDAVMEAAGVGVLSPLLIDAPATRRLLCICRLDLWTWTACNEIPHHRLGRPVIEEAAVRAHLDDRAARKGVVRGL